MAKNSSKSSFLGGAAILAGAVFIVKLIGAVYKIISNSVNKKVNKERK